MFRVDEFNNVWMTRGDDITLTVAIFRDKEHTIPYTMAASDTLTLTVREAYDSASAAFSSTSTGSNTLLIASSTTSNKTCKEYVYDIELVSSSKKHTIIGQDGEMRPVWTILEDVTR